MSYSFNIQRVLGAIPENIVWGRRTPEDETQLAQFFRWIAYVSELSTAEIAERMGLHSTVFFWNLRVKRLRNGSKPTEEVGASPGFLLKAYTFLMEDLFPGCPIDIRQLKVLGETTGDKPDRWKALVAQIQAHYKEQEAVK